MALYGISPHTSVTKTNSQEAPGKRGTSDAETHHYVLVSSTVSFSELKGVGK